MTAHSQAVAANNHRGSLPAKTCSAATEFQVPPEVTRIIGSGAYYSDYPSEVRALSRAKHEGLLEAIPVLADKAAAALAVVDHNRLVDRLTLLGMSMANGKDAAQVQAWLHETARLLSDLPECVLFKAIDDCVKEPGRVFCPTVGEIREKAAAPLQARERQAAHLRRLAKLIEEGVDIPEWVEPSYAWSQPEEPKERCTPEEAAAILAEYGIKSKFAHELAARLKPKVEKTRAEMIAEGHVPPPIKTNDDEEAIRV